MPSEIDLNADIGESYGPWHLGDDETLMPLLSSANLACGFHAGDPRTIRRSVALAAKYGVAIGAHPSFPDLVGFGRRELNAAPEEVYTDVLYQLGALHGFVRAASATLHHVKPHGALYLNLHRDVATARAVTGAVAAFDPSLPLVLLAGPGGEAACEAATDLGLTVIREAFPDRAYTADGHLAPRTQTGAVLHDPREIAARAVQMVVEGSVETAAGESIPLTAQTLCLHGDNPAATEAARTVRAALYAAGVEIRAF